MWPVVQTVRTVFIQDSSDETFVTLLQHILPTSSYVQCPGIADYNQRYSTIHREVQGLQKISVGAVVLRHESERCFKWHVPANQKALPDHRTFSMCVQCKLLDSLLAKKVATHTVSTPEKIARTIPSSHFPLTYLSPASQRFVFVDFKRKEKTLLRR